MSISIGAICLKHIEINRRRVWLWVLRFPVMRSQETLLLRALPSLGLLEEERSCSPVKRAGSPTGLQTQHPCQGREEAGTQDPCSSPSLVFLSLHVDPESQELSPPWASSTIRPASGLLLALGTVCPRGTNIGPNSLESRANWGTPGKS